MSDWKKLLKAYAYNSFIHGVIMVGIIVASMKYLHPFITENITNEDGRVTNFTDHLELKNGNYQITFQVSEYFSRANTKAFYPYVSIVFIIDSPDHYHVPLLLNPYGYSTYRGS